MEEALTLPVPADRVLYQPMQYSARNPPCVPVIETTYQHLLPEIAASLANEAGIRAGDHAARVFCYNLISSNNWNNQHFSDLVKMVIDMCRIELDRRRIDTIEQGLSTSISRALSYYTSYLVGLYPDLQSMITPQIFNAVEQNRQAIVDFNRHVSNLNEKENAVNNGWNNQPLMQVIQTPQGPVQVTATQAGDGNMYWVDQRGMNYGIVQQPQPYPQGMSMRPGMMPQVTAPAVMMPPPMQHNFPPQQNYPRNSTFGNNQPPMNNTFNSWANRNNNMSNPTTDVLGDRFEKRLKNSYNVDPVPEQVEVPVAKEKPKQTILGVRGGSEMDRSKHVINVLVDDAIVNLEPRYMNYMGSVDAFNKTLVDNQSADQTLVYDAPILAISGKDVVSLARATHLELLKESPDRTEGVFRCFFTVIESIVTDEDMTTYTDILRQQTTCTNLAIKLRSLASSLDTSPEARKKNIKKLTFLKTIDRVLTKWVNDFLDRKVVNGIEIGSFASDIPSLQGYIRKTYGEVHARAVADFEEKIVRCFSLYPLEDCKAMYQSDLRLADGIYATPIFSYQSVTLVPLMDEELGFILDHNGVLEISLEISPTLYTVVRSLRKHRSLIKDGKDDELTTLEDLLVTADNVRYRLIDHQVEDKYFIQKLN
jgi:hypothetical protein